MHELINMEHCNLRLVHAILTKSLVDLQVQEDLLKRCVLCVIICIKCLASFSVKVSTMMI